jgi:hypothetical protein
MAELTARLPPAALPAGIRAFKTDFPPGSDPVEAETLIDDDAGWLPSDVARRAAFLQMFRLWHGHVLPEFTARATPAFLFLAAVLPVLAQARDELKAKGLWEPPEGPLRAERDGHPSWRKYCEFLPRAQQAAMEVRPYRTTPLVSGLDGLLERVTAAEKGFREG